MKSIFLLLVCFQLFVASVCADTALITLDNGFTWKAMFDAGFRPSHIGEGIYECRQMNIHVKIQKEEGGEILDLGMGDVEFSLREGHLLDLVAFYGREYRAVGEVEDKSRVFSRIFGAAVTRKAEITWFEVNHTVEYSGRKIDPPEVIRQVNDKNAVNGAKIGDLSIVYSFHSANSREKPIVERISISLGSPKAMQARRLKTKIEPPAGYENISLEPLLAETTPSRTAGPDDPALSAQPSTAFRPAKLAPAPSQPAIEKVSNETSKSMPWMWIIGGILIIVVVGGVLFKLLRK